ncbi:MAG: nucleoside hydrolase [Paludibaculum sp.]
MQFSGLSKPPIGVVFDSALGDGIDDVLALALLYALEGKSETRVVSTSTTKSSLRSAMFAEALTRFLMGPPPPRPTSGVFAGFQRPVPAIGMADNGKLAQDTPVLQAVLDKKNDQGEPLYPRAIARLNETADPAALIRNALTAQNDENCLVLLAGPATNLVAMMALPGSLDLIRTKVKTLLLAWGGFPSGSPDPNVKADPASARQLLATWPGPILAVGSEVGTAIPFPGESLGKDFAWSTAHPIVDAYLAYHAQPFDAPASALAAALYSIRPDSGFTSSAPGALSVAEDARVRFAPGAGGKHSYLLADAARKAEIQRIYVELVSAKPVARPMRRRTQEKKDEVPAAPAKPSDPPN